MSESHRKAQLMELATTAIPGSSVAERSLLSIHESVLKRLKIIFITCHGLAMNARPFRDFTFQCDMDRAKGLDIGNTYITVKAAEQFTHFISEVIRNEIAVDLNKTPYLSVIIDGATDSSVKEQELVYVQHASGGRIKTTFIGIETDLFKKIVAFASDGASVMTGHKSGLVTKLRDKQPHLIGIHCVNHKLELAYKDVFRCYDKLKVIDQLLLDLYYFYERSPLNRTNLQIAREASGIGNVAVTPLRVGGTRWVSYMANALERLFNAYPAIILHLSQVNQ